MTYTELCVLIEHYCAKIAAGNLSYADLTDYLAKISRYSQKLEQAWKERR